MNTLTHKVSNNLNKIYNKLKGKKVLIFDLETTGLFDKKYKDDYWMNDAFNTSRIVEIGYYYSESFDDADNNHTIHSYLRKPTDFTKINPKAEQVHGLSIQKLKSDGITFSKILNKDLLNKLMNCDFIVAHNIDFDFPILLNELFRFNLKDTIQHLLNMKTEKKLLCTCVESGYTRLEKLYSQIFNTSPKVVHRAGDDVRTLVDIIKKKNINAEYKYHF